MELRHYLASLWKWKWLILLSVVVAATSSYFASRSATPLYRTKTTLMVGRVIQNPDPTSGDFSTGQQLAYTYSQLARRQPVLQGAIESLGLQVSWSKLASQVHANVVPQTQLVEIVVVDNDPNRAKVLADTIAQQLILQSPAHNSSLDAARFEFTQKQLTDLQTKIEDGETELARLRQELDEANSSRLIQSLKEQINVTETKIRDWQTNYSQLLVSVQGGDTNVLNVVEEAQIPRRPISPNISLNVALASLIGLIISISGVIMIEYLDNTLKTAEDVMRASGLATVGTIANMETGDAKSKLIALNQPLSPIAEAFRVLRTNLQFSSLDKPIRTLLVTSSSPGEGKSTILANLSVVMAQAGLRVIVVDTDLRRPSLHSLYGLSMNRGLSDAALQVHLPVRDFLQSTSVKNLQVLTSGKIPPNPADLLSSERMAKMIEELSAEADVLLLDSPPTLFVADAAILSSRVDGVLMISRAGHTARNDLQKSMEALKRVHSNIVGVVLNRARQNTNEYAYYDLRKNERKARLTSLVKTARQKEPGVDLPGAKPVDGTK